jgi:hypothetical protein
MQLAPVGLCLCVVVFWLLWYFFKPANACGHSAEKEKEKWALASSGLSV